MRRVGESGTKKGSAENMTQEGRAARKKKLREKWARDLKWRKVGNPKRGRAGAGE